MEEWERFQHQAPTEAQEREAAEESAYTSSAQGAITDAGEAPDFDSIENFTKQSRDKDADRERHRRLVWERRSLSERAKDLETAAQFSRADISREMRLASHALTKAKAKLDREDRAA